MLGIDEVDEVPVAHPLLDLNVGQLSEPFPLAVGRQPSKHREAGTSDARRLVVDPCLQFSRIGAQDLVPVAEHDILLDLVRIEDQSAGRLGDAVEPRLFSMFGHTWSKPGPRNIGAIW